jgi:hypothetical protein
MLPLGLGKPAILPVPLYMVFRSNAGGWTPCAFTVLLIKHEPHELVVRKGR